jgi:hypothetical protein
MGADSETKTWRREGEVPLGLTGDEDEEEEEAGKETELAEIDNGLRGDVCGMREDSERGEAGGLGEPEDVGVKDEPDGEENRRCA